MEAEKTEIELTPKQFSVVNKIKAFLINIKNSYKIEWNTIIIEDSKLFEILRNELDNENNKIIDWLEYTLTEISFFNKKNITIEFEKWEYIKIINKIKPFEYVKYNIKKIIWK